MPGLKKDRERAIPISYLESCFSLDVFDGALHWKVRPRSHFNSLRGWKNFNKQFAGLPAGTVGADGYTRIWLLGRQLLGHRIVFAIANGTWPAEEVDHKDCDRRNSSPINLREAGPLLNQHNIRKATNNTSGAKGVGWSIHARKWRAVIVSHGKRYHLGYFVKVDDAKQAYEAAAKKYNGDFARTQ